VVLQDGVDIESAARELREAWTRVVEDELEVQINIVGTLAPEASGKLRYFVPLEAGTSSS
jgi:hypothetical protein